MLRTRSVLSASALALALNAGCAEPVTIADATTNTEQSPITTPWQSLKGTPGGQFHILGAYGPYIVATALYESNATYVSEDAGQSWAPIDLGLPTGVVPVALTTDNVNLYLATEQGLYKSAGWEKPFTKMTTQLGDTTFADVKYHKSVLYVVAWVRIGDGANDFSPRAFASYDQGAHFSPIPCEVPVTNIVIADDIVFAPSAYAQGIIRSEDFGHSCEHIELSPPRQSLGIGEIVSYGGKLYGVSWPMVVSSDGGRTWDDVVGSPIASKLAVIGQSLLAVEPEGAVWELNGNGVWKKKGGLVPNNLSEMEISVVNETLLAMPPGLGFWRYDKMTADWLSVGPSTGSPRFLAAKGDQVLAVNSQSAPVFSTHRDGRWGWDVPNPDNITIYASALSAGGGTVWMGMVTGQVYRLSDDGTSWELMAENLATRSSLLDGGISSISASGDNVVVGIAGSFDSGYYSGGGIHLSQDRGESWNDISDGLPQRKYGGQFPMPADLLSVVAMPNGDVLATINTTPPYTTDEEKVRFEIYRRNGDAGSWVKATEGVPNTGLNAYVRQLVRDGDAAYTISDGGEVYRTEDSGRTWTRATFGAPEGAKIISIAAGEGYSAALTDTAGVFVSKDHGATGVTAGTGLTGQKLLNITAEGDSIYASVEGQGVWWLKEVK